MNEKKRPASWLSRFTLRGIAGLVALAAVAILAFSLGGLFSSGEKSEPVGQQATEQSGAQKEKKPTIWTCSMHPQIRLPHPGKCPICGMDLIPLVTSAQEELGPRQIRLSETAVQLAQVQTTTVHRAFAEKEVRMVGEVTYDEATVSYITAWVPGRLDRLYADYTGVTVEKGDHMVYMYSPELLAAQEELLQAREAVRTLANSSSDVLRTTATSTLRAARDKLRLLGLTEEQVQKIETTGETTDHLTINAPIGGVVVHKQAKEGMYVKTGTHIYTIADLKKLWVIFDAYESDLSWLRYGQRVQFTVTSFPGERFEALISFIDPVVNPKTRTVRVRAIVDNKKGLLKPDMFVRGYVKSQLDVKGNVIDPHLAGKWISPMHPEIVKNGPGKCDICGMDLVPAESLGYTGRAVSSSEAPLLIPATAPLITGKRAVVYVQIPNEEGPLFEGRVIELGPRAGDFYVVKSGLKDGETVVTNGAFKIDSEMQIQAKPSMMSPAGGTPPPGHHLGSSENTPEKTPSPQTTTEQAGSEISANARNALTPIYKAYFDVQSSLAGDNVKAAKEAFRQVEQAIKEVNMELFTGDNHMKWMMLSRDLSKYASTGGKSSDIVAARSAFLLLSKIVIELHKQFGHAENKDFYLTFCPMADNNNGAYWLQTVDTVYNSFFGKKMLRCGEIKKSLPARPVKGSDHD